MTIKDALDRAKLLKRARQQSHLDEERSRLPEVPIDVAYGAASPNNERRSATVFPPLRSVSFSVESCAEHRILLTELQRRELHGGDAAFRLLRSRVDQILKRNNWHVLGVVSSEPSAGKTVTAINLALALARQKQRQVYVLDLDMRNPSVCAYLGVRDARSIIEFFSGEADASHVLMQSSENNLVVAGAITSTALASELLAGPRLEQLLAHIRLRSPDAIVVVDLPPVSRTDEALVVGPLVDAFLIVVAEGVTERKDLAGTLDVLNQFNIAGVIVNRSSEFVAAKYDQYSTVADSDTD